MSILYEFDEELHNRTMREIAWEEGLAEGREAGMKEGREEGRAEEKTELIQNMLRKKKSPEDISELTDQPVDYIYRIQKEMLSCVSEEINYNKSNKE